MITHRQVPQWTISGPDIRAVCVGKDYEELHAAFLAGDEEQWGEGEEDILA
jgi:hypothetical protein